MAAEPHMEELLAGKTFAETVAALLVQAEARRNEASGGPAGNAAREFAMAMTSLEDAHMRYTRGMAMLLGVFKPADLESEEAIAERRAFLDRVEEARQAE